VARHLVCQPQTRLRHDETVASMSLVDHVSLSDVDRALREAEYLRELLHRERATNGRLAAALEPLTHEFRRDPEHRLCCLRCGATENAPNHQTATRVLRRTT
jgi:hypothetical protein